MGAESVAHDGNPGLEAAITRLLADFAVAGVIPTPATTDPATHRYTPAVYEELA